MHKLRFFSEVNQVPFTSISFKKKMNKVPIFKIWNLVYLKISSNELGPHIYFIN